MLITKIMVGLVILGSLYANGTKLETDPPVILSPKEYISLYAYQYGAAEKELMTVAQCESNFNPKVYGDGGSSHGLFQYQKPTFVRMSKLLGQELDYHSYHDQAKLTAYIFANHPKMKREWTCWRKFYT